MHQGSLIERFVLPVAQNPQEASKETLTEHTNE